MVAYVAVALIDSGQRPDTVYQAAYEAIGRSVPPAVVERLKSGTNERLIAVDRTRFAALLPFFTVKPVYPALISVLHKAGWALVPASILISAVSYGAICFLLYVWISRWVPVKLGIPLAGLLALSPFLTPVAQLSSPDALSTLAILTAMFLAIERRYFSFGMAVLVFSIAVRPENILYCGIFLVYLALFRRMNFARLAAFGAASLGLYVTLTSHAGNYGWRTLFYFAMVDNSIAPASFISPLTFLGYLQIYARQAERIVVAAREGFDFFVLIGVAALCLKARTRPWNDRYFHLLMLAALFAMARFLALPSDTPRALLPAYLMLTVAFIQACAEMTTRSFRPSTGVGDDGRATLSRPVSLAEGYSRTGEE